MVSQISPTCIIKFVMMKSIGIIHSVLLMSFATLVLGCADATTSIFDAINSAKNTAHQSAAEHEATQAKLQGLWNSACNVDQREYVALEVVIL